MVCLSEKEYQEIQKEIKKLLPNLKNDVDDVDLFSKRFILKFNDGINISCDVMQLLNKYNPNLEPASVLVDALDLTLKDAIYLANSLLNYAFFNLVNAKLKE